MKVKKFGLFIVFSAVLALSVTSCTSQNTEQEAVSGQEGTNKAVLEPQPDEIWNDIIPEPGTETIYNIPLSLDNTQQFIDWFFSIDLNDDEKELKNEALGSLVAPCCDEYPMNEC